MCEYPAVTMPRIFITVPGVEDLDSIVVLLRSAGAEITTQSSREFVVNGPITPQRASAVWALAHHLDSGTEERRLTLRIEPSDDLEAALAVMCPHGYERIEPAERFFDRGYFEWLDQQRQQLSGGSIRWWEDQQRRRSQLRKAAAGATPASATTSAQVVCCGRGGAWAPSAGAPVVPGCMLCERSEGTYWRTHRDVGPHERVNPLE